MVQHEFRSISTYNLLVGRWSIVQKSSDENVDVLMSLWKRLIVVSSSKVSWNVGRPTYAWDVRPSN